MTKQRDDSVELAEAKRVLWLIRHIARDAYMHGDSDAASRIMRVIDEYGASRGLVDK